MIVTQKKDRNFQVTKVFLKWQPNASIQKGVSIELSRACHEHNVSRPQVLKYLYDGQSRHYVNAYNCEGHKFFNTFGTDVALLSMLFFNS